MAIAGGWLPAWPNPLTNIHLSGKMDIATLDAGMLTVTCGAGMGIHCALSQRSLLHVVSVSIAICRSSLCPPALNTMLHHSSSLANTYLPVPQEEHEGDEKDEHLPASAFPHPARWWRTIALVLGMLLAASLSVNFILLYRRFSKPWQLYNELPTRFGKTTFILSSLVVFH